MFFVKLGILFAWLLLIGGALRLAMGLYVALTFETQEGMIAASKRYLATANSGEAIDQGVTVFISGLLLGLLAEIAKNTSR